MAAESKHGAVLAGRYQLLEQLGEGGMGSVWKAEHLILHSQVAIKIIDPEIARLEFNLARFLREAKTLAGLRSPHVVQVLDFGSDADSAYLVMELLHGQTLGRRLDQQGRLSLAETTRILRDVCSAMALVHEQGLIHRDLKPENIFLCGEGEGMVTKVVDFGIAKSMRGDVTVSMQTRTGHMLGTPSYMSPEQCRGLKNIDHRTDLWSLGVIAYECLVGKVPFEGDVLGDLLLRICMDPLPVPSRQSDLPLPRAFDAWFAKSVARDRALRFQSAPELAAALAGLSTSSLAAATGAATVSGAANDLALPEVAPVAVDSALLPEPPPRRVSNTASNTLSNTQSKTQSNTQSNTPVGLGIARRKVEPKALTIAFVVVLSFGLALWSMKSLRSTKPLMSVGVESLRPPDLASDAVVTKPLRARVQSGRRWQAGALDSPFGEASTQVVPSTSAEPVSAAAEPATAAEQPATAAEQPATAVQPSTAAQPATALPPSIPPPPPTPPPPSIAPPPFTAAQFATAAQPSPPVVAPAAEPPPRALRGTAAPASPGRSAQPRFNDEIRRAR